MEIQAGKEYKARDGRKVVIYATDAGGRYPIHGAVVVDNGTKEINSWKICGGFRKDSFDSSLSDIVSEWVEPLDFDWDCLPKWSDRFIAMDREGDWYCFYKKPLIEGDEFWDNDGGNCCIIPTSLQPKNYTGDWKDSLHENPKYK